MGSVLAAQISSDPSGGVGALPCTEHEEYEESEMKARGFLKRNTRG